MKFHDASHRFLKAQEKMLRAARKGEVLSRKAEQRPGQMAKKILTKGADALVAEPAKVLAKAALAGTKELALAGAWAAEGAFRGAWAGSKGAAHAIDGLRRLDVSQATIMSDKPAATLYAERIHVLEQGLGYALARADFLSKNPPSVELDVAQYLKLSGIIGAEKIPKMMLMSAAVHSLPIGATALGHFLAPAVEETALHAVGLGNAAVQTGVGLGLVHALHSPMLEALRKSNIVQKDQEWNNYTRELNSAREQLATISKALSAVQKLHAAPSSEEGMRIKRSVLQKIERGLRAAEASVEDAHGGGRASQVNDSLQNQYLQVAANYVLSLGIEAGDGSALPMRSIALAKSDKPASSPHSSSSSLTLVSRQSEDEKMLSDARSSVQSLRSKREHMKRIYECEKLIKGLTSRRDQLRALHDARPEDNALKSDILRLSLRLRTENARLAYLGDVQRPDLQAKLQRAEDVIAAERLAMRHAASALDTGMADILAKQYETRVLHYEARYATQKARFDRNIERLEKQLAAKGDVLAAQKLEAQRERYKVKRTIIAYKAQLASLDAQFAAHLTESNARPNDTFSIKNRRHYLDISRQLERARAEALMHSDRQKRTSSYVTPEAGLLPNAPALVRGTAEASRFLFGVIPGVNLPWWSVRWGSKQLASRRLEAAMQRVMPANLSVARASGTPLGDRFSELSSRSETPALASSALTPGSVADSEVSSLNLGPTAETGFVTAPLASVGV